MTEPPIRSPPPAPPPPPPFLSPPPGRSNIPMLYYGLIVVATAAIILALYNFIVVKWCSDLTDHRSRERANRSQRGASSSSRDLSSIHLNIPGFKYRKDEDCGSECAVCLSAFEEGEELRRLPKCKHSFHAPCIDMWLYSHMDCPLCRSPVDQPATALPQRRAVVVDQSEHSREGLLAQVTIV